MCYTIRTDAVDPSDSISDLEVMEECRLSVCWDGSEPHGIDPLDYRSALSSVKDLSSTLFHPDGWLPGRNPWCVSMLSCACDELTNQSNTEQLFSSLR